MRKIPKTEFRLGSALMAISAAAGLAKTIRLHTPPIFEVIIPMTQSAEEMIALHQAYQEKAGRYLNKERQFLEKA